ncbi:MAG: DUF3606 domain-containing protein [Pseudomonadota bacterium]
MSDNLQGQCVPDRSIYLHEEMEVAYWMKELGVSRDQLRDAVKQAGTGATAVRNLLGLH